MHVQTYTAIVILYDPSQNWEYAFNFPFQGDL